MRLSDCIWVLVFCLFFWCSGQPLTQKLTASQGADKASTVWSATKVTFISTVAACGHTNWVPEWEAGAVWKETAREIMEAKTCFCSRPQSLLRVYAYKESIPCRSILDAHHQPVGNLPDRTCRKPPSHSPLQDGADILCSKW